MDPLTLYELCVTDPARVVPFIHAVHADDGGLRVRRGSGKPRGAGRLSAPRVLREDFSGSGALARAWAAQGDGFRSIAVDRDRVPLARAKAPRVTTRRANVMACADRADVIAALNFPLGYFHRRSDLLAYLRASRSRLTPRGVLIADMYGGPSAFRPLKAVQRLRAPTGERVEYTWEQREASEVTGLVTDALHFRVWPASRRGSKAPRGRSVASATTGASRARPQTCPDAFVYHWRLWSIPELRDALTEAGFSDVRVFDQLGDAIDQDGNLHVTPCARDHTFDGDWVVYVVARK
jgi:hypothetical protein